MNQTAQPELPEIKEQEAPAEAKERSVMPFNERVKLVDYLRALRSPIAAETKLEAARVVSEALKLEVSWNHIRYVIEQMPEAKLAERFVFGDETERALLLRVSDLEEQMKLLLARIAKMESALED